MSSLQQFATEVGSEGPVAAAGAGTHDEVGGVLVPDVRRVAPPASTIFHDPPEMIVRCDAGITVAQLNGKLAEAGQMVPLDPHDPEVQTVGGVLSVGWSGVRRLGYGHLRDLLLGMTYVSAEGKLIKAGGQTVKNVSGYDLCRLFVGSLGTLGLIAEVVLRCLPLPGESRWFISSEHPLKLYEDLYRPTSVMWDGERTWVLLEGDPADVLAQSASFNLVEAAAPVIPFGSRGSVSMRELGGLSGKFLVELGVGTVHRQGKPELIGPGSNAELQRTVKRSFDPTARLAPGRVVWGEA